MVDAEQWYKGLIYQLYLGVKLTERVNVKKWWLEQSDLSLVQRLNDFIVRILLPRLENNNLIIFIDEIDSVFKLPFDTDDFFAFIRYCYNQRAIDSVYCRVTFVLFGVTTPSQSIGDARRTPFNIGQSIELTEFTLKQAKVLTRGFNYAPSFGQLIIKNILYWTEGQPFLTQKLCRLFINSYPSIDNEDKIEALVNKLVGVEKKIGSKVNPSQTLFRLNKIGFNDLILERDAKVRRALLSYQPKSEKLQFSFALRLALMYLESKNIQPEYDSLDNSKVRLGKSLITPLKPNSGSYVNPKTGGYQILLKIFGDRRLIATIILITLAYLISILSGQFIKQKGVAKYVTRLNANPIDFIEDIVVFLLVCMVKTGLNQILFSKMWFKN